MEYASTAAYSFRKYARVNDPTNHRIAALYYIYDNETVVTIVLPKYHTDCTSSYCLAALITHGEESSSG